MKRWVPPKYKVVAHRRVQKFLISLKDENLKLAIINQMTKQRVELSGVKKITVV